MTKDSFPTLFSTPHPDALAERVLSEYALAQPIRCELYKAGRNDHYRVYAGDEAFHMKVMGASRQDWLPERIRTEVALLAHLHEHGIPVAVPVARRDGEYVNTIDAPEGLRCAWLTRALPGRPLGDSASLEQVREVATSTARMHACMDLLPDDFTPVHWNLHSIVDLSLARLEPVLQHREADRAYVGELGESIRGWIGASLPMHEPEYGIIHGDLHQDNIIVDEARLSFVDTESFGRGWRAWDIAFFLSGDFRPSDWTFDQWLRAERHRRRDAFLTSYTAERGLSEMELASIPVFGAARILLALGRIVELMVRVDGEIAASRERVDKWLRFLRAWVEHHELPL